VQILLEFHLVRIARQEIEPARRPKKGGGGMGGIVDEEAARVAPRQHRLRDDEALQPGEQRPGERELRGVDFIHV
jgi:hypothetical protein